MFRQRARMLVWIAFLALVAGCGNAEPTAKPQAQANTPVPTSAKPAATPVPSTETPFPATAEPAPTATPTAEPDVTGHTWFKTYGANRDDVANDLLLADDGGFFIVGATNLEFGPAQQGDIYLIKTNAAGDILWEKTYGGQGYQAGATAVKTSDGGLIISGATDSVSAGGIDIHLLKVDKDGNELWSKTFGGPLDQVGAAWPMDDGGYILGGNIVDPNDPVVDDPGVAGYAGFAGRSNVYLARTDSEGKELWSRKFGGDNNVLASSGLQTPDGGFIILATIMHFPVNDDDIYLLKVDQNGNEVWSHTWGNGMSSGYDLVRTSDGNLLITGPYSPPEERDRSKRDFLFIKVDPEGNEIWTSTFGNPDIFDYGQVLAATTDGGCVAVGEAGSDLTTWDQDIVIVKVDENGKLLWKQSFEAGTHSMFGTVLQHPDGGYVVAGSMFSNRNFDIFVLKTDAQANVTAASEPAALATPALDAISLDAADRVELLRTLEGHRDRVFTLTFSGDGAYLASSSRDKTIRLWDLQSGQEVQTFNMNEVGLNGIAFSPDGRLLASADAIWDVESRQVVHALERARQAPGPVAFSPDGSLLAVAVAGQAIKLWDVTSGQVVRTFEKQADNDTFSIAFSPDGARLAASGHDGWVRLWDVESGQIAGILDHGNDSDVHDVAFSPDGSVLASGGTDYTVQLWDVASGQVLHTMWHRDGLYSVALSPSGTIVASAGVERTVRLWDAEGGGLLRTLPHDDEVMTVAFSPDGTRLASGGYDHQIYLWGIHP